MMVNGR
jgi:hypothetical protein